MSVANALPVPSDCDCVELEAVELAALLCALGLDARAARSSAAAGDVDRLRHAVARACGPIAATATLSLPLGDRQAIAEVLERQIESGPSQVLGSVDVGQLARRLTAASSQAPPRGVASVPRRARTPAYHPPR